MARLKPAQSIDQAAAALNAFRPAIRDATMPPDDDAERRARYLNNAISLFPAATGVSPPDLHGELRARFEQPLTIIMMVVAAVLFIACANIANLMLARAAARRHELSLRLALGASRMRLGGQMFIESLILAVLGGLAGLGVAEFGAPFLIRQLGTDLGAVTLDLSIDWRVLESRDGFPLEKRARNSWGVAAEGQRLQEVRHTMKNEDAQQCHIHVHRMRRRGS